MQMAKVWLTRLTAVGFTLLICTPTQAQRGGQGQISRTPGNMVNEGIARAQAAVRDPFAATEITQEPDTTPDFRETFATDAMQIIIDQITQLFEFLVGRLLARAGFAPLFEIDSFASLTGTNGTSDATNTNETGSIPGSDPGASNDGADPGADDLIDDSGSSDSGSSDQGGVRRPGRG